MVNLTVHIGFPKTGTTSLQNHVFPALKNYRYLDYFECVELFSDLQFADDLAFDPEQLKSKLEAFQEQSGKPLFASLESLVGYLFHPSAFNRTRNIQRLLMVADELRLVVSTRNTVDLMDAVYRQYVQKGGVLKPKDLFVDHFAYDSHQKVHLSFFEQEKFIQWIKTLNELRGLLVLKFEDLKNDVAQTNASLSNFLGEEIKVHNAPSANVSLSNASLSVLRSLNYFSSTFLRPLSSKSILLNGHKMRYGVQDYIDPIFRKLGAKKHNYIKRDNVLFQKAKAFLNL